MKTRITFLDDNLIWEGEGPILLEDAAREVSSSIPFGCKRGRCAVCLVDPVDGKERLPEPDNEEVRTLTRRELEDGVRLACRVIVNGGDFSFQKT